MLCFSYLPSCRVRCHGFLRCLMCLRALLSSARCASRAYTIRWHGNLRCLMCLRALLPCYVWFPCRSVSTALVHFWVMIQYQTIVLTCSASHHLFLVRHTAVRALCVFSDIARTKRVLFYELFILVFLPKIMNS